MKYGSEGNVSRDAVHLTVVVGILLSIGLALLFSASAVTCETNARFADPHHFLKKQILWMAIAGIGFLVASRVPTSFWMRARLPLLLATAALLALVFVPGVGATINGARRWLRFGGFFMQPSELAKLALGIFLCGFAAADAERLKSFARGFVPMFVATGWICGLVVIEPDVGTAAFIGVTSVVLMTVAGARWTHLLPTCGVGAAAAAVLVVFRMEHFQRRLAEWWNGTGYQLHQSLVALGAGGVCGEGLGRGTQKLYFLPEVHSDFIFAVLGEEFGFLGTCGVLGLFAAFGVVGWRIARRASTPFGGLLAFVLTFQVLLQAAMNVAVVTGLMPTKGIPLPFFSFGGSSLCITMAAVGILVRIANETERGATCESASPGVVPAVTCSRG
jgi:cell division protein FtsW